MTDPKPGRHLLAASTGGHLAQLVKWSRPIGSSDDSLWVTFDTPQSRSLLHGRRVVYVPYIAPRDFRGVARSLIRLAREIDWESEQFDAAVSTGAALALAALPAARLKRVPTFYFESVSRVDGPSLSGKLISLDPGTRVSCQYESWSGSRWKYRGTLFDHYEVVPQPIVERPRLFITLGTIEPYRFDSLVDAILETGLANDQTVWQTGCTHRNDLPGRVFQSTSSDEFDSMARDADVVITHSGVGTIMKLFDLGISPVIVPRRAGRNEHVDDHQLQIAGLLRLRGLGVVAEVPEIDREVVLAGSRAAVKAA